MLFSQVLAVSLAFATSALAIPSNGGGTRWSYSGTNDYSTHHRRSVDTESTTMEMRDFAAAPAAMYAFKREYGGARNLYPRETGGVNGVVSKQMDIAAGAHHTAHEEHLKAAERWSNASKKHAAAGNHGIAKQYDAKAEEHRGHAADHLKTKQGLQKISQMVTDSPGELPMEHALHLKQQAHEHEQFAVASTRNAQVSGQPSRRPSKL